MVIYTQEKIGLIPQSIGRTFGRARKQLLPEGRLLAIEEFRISRLRTIVALQCLIILIVVPFFVNCVGKTFVIKPSIQKIWNIEHNEIFLNSYQMKRAFHEMEEFQNILFFESLNQDNILENSFNTDINEIKLYPSILQTLTNNLLKKEEFTKKSNQEKIITCHSNDGFKSQSSFCRSKSRNGKHEELIKHKAVQLAFKYNQQSIQAITDFSGDIVTIITIRILLLQLKAQIVFLKAFLLECFYSLNDAKKSVFIFFFTDLLVGYHSPKGWQLVTEMILRHYGLSENPIFIKFIIAILPVLLDTLFKYWIFRHLNRTSPSTVVTYHALIE